MHEAYLRLVGDKKMRWANRAAGAAIVGGHSVRDAEIKYELAFDVVIFDIQPVGDTFCVGDIVFLFASASGFPDYQSFKDDVPIPGATQPFLVIIDANVEDSGGYFVFAINECDSLDISDTANVIVENCGDVP